MWRRNLRSHAVLVVRGRGDDGPRRRRGPHERVRALATGAAEARVAGQRLRQGSRGRQRREPVIVRRGMARALRRARERREHRPHRRPRGAPGDAPAALCHARQAARARPKVGGWTVPYGIARERRVEVLVVNHCLDEITKENTLLQSRRSVVIVADSSRRRAAWNSEHFILSAE